MIMSMEFIWSKFFLQLSENLILNLMFNVNLKKNVHQKSKFKYWQPYNISFESTSETPLSLIIHKAPGKLSLVTHTDQTFYN